jgi:hypothetical protein
MDLHAYNGKFFTLRRICASVEFRVLAGTFWTLENVPGKSTNPAKRIHVENLASRLSMGGMSSRARSMLTYCVSI